jgi:hypothetical protein
MVDSGDNTLKEWIASTQQVTTLVSSGLNSPMGVAVDGAGNVYAADDGNNAVKQWMPYTRQVATLVSSGLRHPAGVAVDGAGNVYIADEGNNAIKEMPHAFIGPVSLTESPAAGTDSLLQVIPSTTSLVGVFAPTSDQGWLTIGTAANGVASFSFMANTAQSARVAHVTVLGHQITVTQNGGGTQTISFLQALPDVPLGTGPITLTATASSGLLVSYNSQASACSVTGSQLTLVSAGTCAIQATQAGNSSYMAAAPVTRSFNVTANLCDINHDNVTDVLDVQGMIKQALGINSAGNDLNGDGAVNLVDVQIVIDAAMKMGCMAQ